MNKLTLIVIAMCSACAIGAPPGFSNGDTWTFPLVDPLDDAKLVTPVYIEGKGPYLCAIDPDAPRTVIDNEVLAIGQFRARGGARLINEQDVSHPTFYTTVTNIQIGDLAISQRTVVAGANGAFNTPRRRIYGIIGRDVIADSLVFGFDRERGIAWLQTAQAFKPPPDAKVLEYFKGTRRRPDLVVRRLVTANVDGQSYDLHLDLGDVPSQLRPEHWREAKLDPKGWQMTLVDETSSKRTVSVDGIAEHVVAGPIARDHIGFVPYDDKRWVFGQLEGTLGLDFFRPFSVAADWQNERYYLTPRHDSPMDAAGRFARWGTAVPASCSATGCMTTSIVAQDAQVIVQAERDPRAGNAALETLFRATATTGSELPRLYVSLPAGVDHVAIALQPGYENAKLEPIDVSPFPFSCNGCVVSDVPLPP